MSANDRQPPIIILQLFPTCLHQYSVGLHPALMKSIHVAIVKTVHVVVRVSTRVELTIDSSASSFCTYCFLPARRVS
jgi:hypothetical protein